MPELAHYGVRGMKWGVRRTRSQLDADSPDSAKVKTLRTKAAVNKSTDPLSNEELQTVVTRMNLEQQYRNLKGKEAEARMSKGKKFLRSLVSDVGKQQASRTVNTVINERVDNAIKKK